MSVSGQIVAEIAETVWRHRVAKDVYLQLRNGLPVVFLPMDDLESAESDETFAQSQLRKLAAVDFDALQAEDRLTAEFLTHRLEWDACSTSLWWSAFPVTPYNSMWLSLYLQWVLAPFRFETPEDGERYTDLLADYATLIGLAGRKLERLAARGWRVPRPALATARRTLEGYAAQAASVLHVDRDRLAGLGSAAKGYPEKVGKLIDEEIATAFAGLQEALGSEYEAAAPESVGIGQYPGGMEAYDRLIRYQTTLDIEARTVHELGLCEVAEISDEMAALRSELGFSDGEERFHRHLAENGLMFARTAAEVEKTYTRCMDRIKPLLQDYFSVLPDAPYGVQRLDPASEEGMSYGYYQPPTEGQAVGLYRYNGSGLESRSQLNAAALIYHELVPGHHFHLARQKENESLPMIRREAIDLAVFNEGWAEYASALAGEMGLYDDPYVRYGRLVHERFTAQRLVVDTGMNALGWSLADARDYMSRQTLESEEQVKSETLRYSTDMPAQALAYRIGFLKISALRDRARLLQGEKFDLRDFHEWILGPGALPLPVLEQHIERRAAG